VTISPTNAKTLRPILNELPHASNKSHLSAPLAAYQSPSGCPLPTCVRLRIMNLAAGFSATAAANAARASPSERQVASVS
jgi:hypothetical protein